MRGWQNSLLRDELNNDPLTIGYAGMTDQQAADSLNAATRAAPDREVLSAGEIYDAVVRSELNALSAAERAEVEVIFGLGSTVLVGPGSKARATLAAIFPAPAVTRENLLALVTNLKQSRAAELGLPEVLPTDVARMRGV